jgi:hypothetical protein
MLKGSSWSYFSRQAVRVLHLGFHLLSEDDDKPRCSRKKHGISFEEAQTIFLDGNALMIHDRDHSDAGDRFILLESSAIRAEQKRYWGR